MKKYFIALPLVICLIFAGGVTLTAQTKKAKATSTASATKVFTIAELKKYDGKNGHKAYVAVDGTVYDVTNAKNWKNGNHKGGISAGKDLTKAISRSPHGKEVLKGLKIVGKLK